MGVRIDVDRHRQRDHGKAARRAARRSRHDDADRGRELRKVTVVVYEVKSGVVGRVLAREASTFDQAQG